MYIYYEILELEEYEYLYVQKVLYLLNDYSKAYCGTYSYSTVSVHLIRGITYIQYG